MSKRGLATDDEITLCRKLYNIERISNMLIALLELIYRVL